MFNSNDLISADERSFWNNDLDVHVEDVLWRAFSSPEALWSWIEQLPTFAMGTFCLSLGIDETNEALAKALAANLTPAVPLALCQAFQSYKRNDVLEAVAAEYLDEEALERCRFTPSKFERLLLVWQLYKVGLETLKEVELLNTTRRKGFARYELIHNPVTPSSESAGFFDRANIQSLLDEVDSVSNSKLRYGQELWIVS